MAKQTVTLNPGENKVVSFQVIPHEAKTYNVSVNGLTGSFVAIEAPIFDPWQYDTDNSCYIEFVEWVKAVDDYGKGIITEAQYNQVAELYQYDIRNPACAPVERKFYRAYDEYRPDIIGPGMLPVEWTGVIYAPVLVSGSAIDNIQIFEHGFVCTQLGHPRYEWEVAAYSDAGGVIKGAIAVILDVNGSKTLVQRVYPTISPPFRYRVSLRADEIYWRLESAGASIEDSYPVDMPYGIFATFWINTEAWLIPSPKPFIMTCETAVEEYYLRDGIKHDVTENYYCYNSGKDKFCSIESSQKNGYYIGYHKVNTAI